MAYCMKLSGEICCVVRTCKIESVGLRDCPRYHNLTKKVMSQQQTFRTACPTSWRENSWHRYVTKK